jgi:hypothetical protein
MTQILLHADPGTVMGWEEFTASHPPFSMALDGYVSGLTRFSAAGPHANFNHHEAVDRMATRSTCMQIFFSMKLGLFDTFQKNGAPFAHVWVNDADQDICLSYWLLKNHEQAQKLAWDHPLARFLVYEDFMDSSAGAYPFDDLDQPNSLLKRQAWVFEPYTRARSNRLLHAMQGHELTEIIETICDRITLFANSEGESCELDMTPEIIGGGPGWKMVIETSIYSRAGIYTSGTRAFVGMRRRNDGNFTYVIGKMSPFVQFPIMRIFDALNAAEPESTPDNAWGGGNIIGGSPRKKGSALSPDQVEAIINHVIATD